MGIGGSGIAGVALLAKKMGYRVSGCDYSAESPYLPSLNNSGIKIDIGHSPSHLKGADILAISPAVLSLNRNHPEVVAARKKGILLTWQQFMGRYLQKNKFVIAVAGTHGKSTTTAMLGLLLEDAGLDPSVEVGAIVPQWKASTRFGASKYFVCEADEFNLNFLNFTPSIIILNNIEMDHPEYFSDYIEFKNAFNRFIAKLTGPRILIANQDSPGVKESMAPSGYIGYSLKTASCQYKAKIIASSSKRTVFEVKSGSCLRRFNLPVPGVHNVANALGVIACADQLNIDDRIIFKSLDSFRGINRRFEFIGQVGKVKIFDDYAHHPTAVKATISAARARFPRSRLWLILEPHQYSRLRLFMSDFARVLKFADKVIVIPVFAGREKDVGGAGSADLVRLVGSKSTYQPDFDQVVRQVKQQSADGDIIIVCGAGRSYLLSRQILSGLKQT